MQGAVEQRNQNYVSIMKNLTFTRKPWFEIAPSEEEQEHAHRKVGFRVLACAASHWQHTPVYRLDRSRSELGTRKFWQSGARYLSRYADGVVLIGTSCYWCHHAMNACVMRLQGNWFLHIMQQRCRHWMLPVVSVCLRTAPENALR